MTQSEQGASTQKLLPVIQADREAAWPYRDKAAYPSYWKQPWMDGAADDCGTIQDFARHRIEHTPSDRNAVLREAGRVAYRVCAETRHVTLGRKAEDAILALTTTPEPTDG